MNDRQINRLVKFLLAIAFVACVILILNTQSSMGGADAISHYLKGHWGWKYPELLFNHWGKPPFTILISPFAQFGINGARVYNLIMGFLTAILSWRLAKLLHVNNSYLSLLLVLFTPLYFILMFSTLTEVTFSFFLALGTLLFFREKYILSAVILSFLPILRNEGIILLPIFILALSIKKQFWSLPFLSFGFWLISVLGFSFYDDFWWLITKMPYASGASDIYGSGSLFHFIFKTDKILGYPIAGLFILGLFYLIFNWVKVDKCRITQSFYFILLIPGSYLIFLSAHSYVWWQGMGNSLGLLRVMGSVSPFAAITALVGINLLQGKISKWNKLFARIFTSILLIWIVWLGCITHQGGFSISPNLKLIGVVADYLKDNNLDRHKLFYYDPYLMTKLNRDPYDLSKNRVCLPDNENPSSSVPDSSIVVWDAHFGPNEGRLALEKLTESPEFTLLKIFRPARPFKVLGGYDYAVYIFQKIPKQNRTIDSSSNIIDNYYFDYESSTLSDSSGAYTGKYSHKVLPDKQFVKFISIPANQISPNDKSFKVEFSAALFSSTVFGKEGPLIVFALDEDSKNLIYQTYKAHLDSVDIWKIVKHTFYAYEIPSQEGQFKVYLWNNVHATFLMDEVRIKISYLDNNNELIQ